MNIIDSVDYQFAFWKTGPVLERFAMGDFGTRGERSTARRGATTLYISNGAIMGASPLADYAAPFAWGLTADVASRKLTNAKS